MHEQNEVSQFYLYHLIYLYPESFKAKCPPQSFELLLKIKEGIFVNIIN